VESDASRKCELCMGEDFTNSFEIAESGARKTGEGDAGVPETVSPNQYDG
jgi:hypothetical protein